MHEPPSQDDAQANVRKGVRALFRKAEPGDGQAEVPGDGLEPSGAAAPGETDLETAAGGAAAGGRAAGGRAAGGTAAGGRAARSGPRLTASRASAVPGDAGTGHAGAGHAGTGYAGTGHADTGEEPAVAEVGASSLTAERASTGPVSTGPVTTGHITTGHVTTRPAPRRPRTQQYVRALAARQAASPRLRSDPRLRVWVIRAIVAMIIFVGFSIGLNWRYGVTAAIIYAAADSIYRSKTTAVIPAAARITSAQRFTRRRLKVLQPAGYLALHARRIPGTRHIIDHVVVGPPGVFTLDSQRLDRRLPLRVIGGMLYHGRSAMDDRLEHARHEANHAESLIAGEFGQRVRVRPVMVMYGPSISWVIMKVKGVDVFDGSRVGTYFRRQSKAAGKHRLTSTQIATIFAAAARALPPLN